MKAIISRHYGFTHGPNAEAGPQIKDNKESMEIIEALVGFGYKTKPSQVRWGFPNDRPRSFQGNLAEHRKCCFIHLGT
ncbi:hypothetical protein AXFE_01060 [Acidithrix ferrooxidans]|uniref:Uncharacterized protein n=1 Tax=Acidithrix ferrooxidans TaxID=1280514 RepID=A0A0D8HMJ0_9ACTN|nr:hypothetical protein AXFE_01060 [Acidithrix ferrooxidans]